MADPQKIVIGGQQIPLPIVGQQASTSPKSQYGLRSGLMLHHFIFQMFVKNELLAERFLKGESDDKPIMDDRLMATLIQEFPQAASVRSSKLTLFRTKYNTGKLLSGFPPIVASFAYRPDGKRAYARSKFMREITLEEIADLLIRNKIPDPRWMHLINTSGDPWVLHGSKDLQKSSSIKGLTQSRRKERDKKRKDERDPKRILRRKTKARRKKKAKYDERRRNEQEQ